MPVIAAGLPLTFAATARGQEASDQERQQQLEGRIEQLERQLRELTEKMSIAGMPGAFPRTAWYELRYTLLPMRPFPPIVRSDDNPGLSALRGLTNVARATAIAARRNVRTGTLQLRGYTTDLGTPVCAYR